MKKLTSILTLLLLFVAGTAMAATYEITYDTSTGVFWRNGAVSTDNWSSKWVSNEAGKPVVTITTSVNNMNAANGRIAPQTYTITVEGAYKVTGFTMDCPTFGGTITVTPNGESATEVATGEKIQLTSSASSFVFAASANGARIQAASSDGGSFVITVEDAPEVGIMKEVNSKVTENLWTMQTTYGVTESDKIYTESSDGSEGNIPALLDNNYGSFHHSDWHNTASTIPHWLTYELPDATNGIRFYIKQRQSVNNGRPLNVTVAGSNDNSTFTNVTTLDLTWAGSPLDTYSDAVQSTENYKYWRITVNTTSNSSTPNWFCVSEWYVLPNNSVVNTLFDAENQYRAGNFPDETTAQTLLDNVNAAITELKNATNYYTFVENEVLPYLYATPSDPSAGTAASVGKYFGVSIAVYSQVASDYATQIANKSFTEAEYNAIKAAVLGAIVYPETGYYRIKNTNRERNSYLTYGLPSNLQDRGDGLVTVDESQATTDAGSIIKLVKTGENNYKVSTQGMFVKAPTANNHPFRTDAESAAVTYKFTVVTPGSPLVAIGPADVTDTSAQRYFHEGDGATWGEVHAVVQWLATSSASQWTVEDANELGGGAYALTVALTEVDGKSYATTCLPFPAGLRSTLDGAYKVSISGKKAVEELISGAIPAGEPVLLISDDANTVSYIYVADESTVASVSGNELKGVFKNTNQADLEGDLPVVLNVANGKIGFYKLSDTGSLPANKAYLSYTEGSTTSKEFFEEGFELGGSEVTGINTIENGADNGAVFNLQGQRVNKAQKGVYIQNGKKVVLK